MWALRAEWVKLRSEPGLAASALALALATAGYAALAVARAEPPVCPDDRPGCDLPIVDTVRLGLSGVYIGQLFAVVLATLAVADEYATGLIGTTLLATPRRLAIVAAKAVAAVGAVAVAGAFAVAASVVTAGALLPARGFTAGNGYPPIAPTDPSVLRAGGGTVLYLALVALLAVGIAFAARDTTVALATALSLLYLLPLAGMALRHEAVARLVERYAPMPAGLAIQVTVGLESLPIGGWAGLAVLAAWSAGAILVGWARFAARDA